MAPPVARAWRSFGLVSSCVRITPTAAVNAHGDAEKLASADIGRGVEKATALRQYAVESRCAATHEAMDHHDTVTMKVLTTPAKTMEGLILKLWVFCAFQMDSASDPVESLLADAKRIGGAS